MPEPLVVSLPLRGPPETPTPPDELVPVVALPEEDCAIATPPMANRPIAAAIAYAFIVSSPL
jgi:hypothetical protein